MNIAAAQRVWPLPMPSTYKIVLITLAYFADDEGFSCLSPEMLEKKTGLKERSIRKAKKHLKEEGFIKDAPEMGRCGILLLLDSLPKQASTSPDINLENEVRK